MLLNKRIVVVMPAYKAEKTLRRTVEAIPRDIVDEIILVDDASHDGTIDIANKLNLKTFVHNKNLGYGANQKTCYFEALNSKADIIIMVHPDYQYEPRLVTAMAAMISSEIYDIVLGSRILGGHTIAGGMPYYKYFSNRFLTAFQNIMLGTKISEFHTGYRAFSRKVLQALPLLSNSDDYLFDNQLLAQAIALGFSIGEISCPTKYFPEASSISVKRAIKYGFGVLITSLLFRMWRFGLIKPRIFSDSPTLKYSQTVYYHSLDKHNLK